MPRILAIDYGDKRTGVCLSDPTGTLAGQAQTLTLQGKNLIAAIVDMAERNQVETVVVGLPRNMDGSYGFRAEITQEFVEKLRTRGLNIVLRDERLTTVSAHNILNTHNKRGDKRKAVVDAVAASLILQDYLDFLNRPL
ncbi:MAG: Holliday junction resolvase RuvX [Oscillospiraceae bacterium]|nr:Holliday junction resolvase RuvX [Oscillospiraceae bacterium]